MKIKKTSIRTDILTREKYPKEELLRIDINKNGDTTIDYNFIKNGRGIYFHRNSLEKLLKKNILKNILKKYNGSFELIKDELEKLMID